MPVGDLLPELVLIVTAVAILLSASFIRQEQLHWCAALAMVGLVAALWLSLLQSDKSILTFSGVWVVDQAAVYGKCLILLATLVTVVLSPEWLSRDRRHGEYYALLLFSALGAIMLASSHDAMELVMGMLLSSAASYPLIAFHRAWGPSLEAGMKFFLLSALANAILLIGVTLLYGLVGDTDYSVVKSTLNLAGDPLVIIAIVGFLTVGLSFKLAAFPLYSWMPDVAQGAPLPVAGFLSVVPKIGASIALVRVLTLLPEDLAWRPMLVALSVATMTLGNLGALWQTDVRRLLGWSSISQSGYALMAIVVVGQTTLALPALLLFLTAYTIANLAAFAVITSLRGRTALADFHGLASVQPAAAIVLILALLSLVGIPPLIGFFGKFNLFSAVIAGGYGWLAVVAIINTVISLFYYLRIVSVMLLRRGGSEVHRLGRYAQTTALLMGVAVLLFGLAVEWVMLLSNQSGMIDLQGLIGRG